MKTLSRFAAETGINKGTLYRKCQELGIPTSNGLDDNAVAQLRVAFKIPERPEPLKPSITQGNHRDERILQTHVQSANLEHFRSDKLRKALGNPQDMMQNLDVLLSAIETGMEQAESQQEQELLHTRKVKRVVEKRVETFRLRASEYRLRSDILSTIQNSDIDAIEELQAEVNTLGKSPNS